MHRFYLTVNDYQSQKLNDKEQPKSNDSNQPKSPHLKSLPGNSPRFNNKGQNNLSPPPTADEQHQQHPADDRPRSARVALARRLALVRRDQNNLSPHTIRRNISKENFMKYQWAWTL
jgi:hypothetical protein